MLWEKFERLLTENNVRVADVCRATGIHQTTFSHWKHGKYTPKPDKIQKIADYFNVPISYFYGEQTYEVAAGQGRLNDDYVEVTKVTSDNETARVRIVGDSMYPSLHDGDLVRVKYATKDISPKDFAIVKINGDESTCKHVEITSEGIWLRAENKEVFEDKFYTVQDVMTLPVTLIGVATEIIRRKL